MRLCVGECISVVELNAGSDKVDSLWVRIRGKANKADNLVGVCYRSPNRDEEVDEALDKQMAEVTQLLAHVLIGKFKLPDIY